MMVYRIMTASSCLGANAARRLLAIALLSIPLLGLGCSNTKGKGELTGKVTLQGAGVDGTLVLIGTDKKEITGSILNGKYLVESPPKGEYDVVIRRNPGAKDPPKVKGAPGVVAAEAGVPPPEKYSKAGVIPKLNVTGGKQSQDFELTP